MTDRDYLLAGRFPQFRHNIIQYSNRISNLIQQIRDFKNSATKSINSY